MLAIIETGGKQYRVSPGQIITIEKLPDAQIGSSVVFDKVLLASDGKTAKIGAPYLSGEKVEGEVIRAGRGDKILVLRYKAKTRMRRYYGHRQPFVMVKIK